MSGWNNQVNVVRDSCDPDWKLIIRLFSCTHFTPTWLFLKTKCLKCSLHPRSNILLCLFLKSRPLSSYSPSILSVRVRPAVLWLSLCCCQHLLKDEGMSFISLDENSAPLQMLCHFHLILRWDLSNQSSQLPLVPHHFPSSHIDLSLIYLKGCQSDFILTHHNL